jgi:chromosomal replication initiator protein
VWARVCTSLRGRIGEQNFAAWIAPLRSTWANGSLALEAPDATARERVARHFLSAIEAALAEAVGGTYPVRLGLTIATSVLPFPVRQANPHHSFETFVLGASNSRACAAAQAVTERPASGPLYLHGPSGVGKTHLLHAISHGLDAAGVSVACLSAAQLVAALVTAYQAGADERFWSDLSPLGALLLDDVHSVKGLEQIQERLMEGLEALVESGRLLVLTSDRPPDDTPALVGGLRARFARSVVAMIDPPDAPLRLAILHYKAMAQGLSLDGRLAARLANEITGSVRRLEGALTRLVAHARLSGRQIDETLASEVLPELRPQARVPITPDRIIEAAARAFAVPARRLRGHGRSLDLTLARHVAMYLARKLLRRPFSELAAAFGRDHTTVLHACRGMAARVERDAELAATMARVEQELGRGEGP